MTFKKMKRFLSLSMAFVMSAGLMTGFTAAAEEDPIAVRMVMWGEQSPRMKEIMEGEVYEKILEEINVDLELIYLPHSEYAGGKSELMYASGEKFMSTMDTAWAPKLIAKGLLTDLTDYVEEYAPELLANTNPTDRNSFIYDGKLYAVPIGNKPNAGEDYLFMVRRDLMDEVGVESISTIEEFENFYQLCKEKHPDYIGLGRGIGHKALNGAIASDMNVEFINNFVITDGNARDDSAIYSYYESEEFKQACEITKRWKEMELIPPYELSNPDQSISEFNIGHAMFAVSANDRIFEMTDIVRNSVPDVVWENIYLGDKTEKPLMTRGNYTTAFAISAGVEDPEEIAAYMKVINLLQKNQEWVDIWTYGIEGTDYTLSEDGVVTRINTDEFLPSWLPVNANFRRYPEYVTKEQIETYNTQADGCIEFKQNGFSLDLEPVKAEYAQMQAVESEYLMPIYKGFKDYDENIDEAIEKLKAAGIDKFMEEVQRQFDEFISGKAK